MFVRLIYLKNFNFSQSENICWHTDWCQEWNIKTSITFQKSVKNEHMILLSRRCEYSSPAQGTVANKVQLTTVQLTANCIATKMCLQHYIKLIWESPTSEDQNFYRYKCSFHSKLESNGL